MRKPKAQQQLLSGPRQEIGIWRFCAAIQNFVVRAFPEREILLRADGRVHFFRVNSFVQIACATVVLMLLPAVVYTAARDLLFPETMIVRQSQEVAKLKSANSQLQADHAESQSHYRLITRQLEAKHAYLLNILQQNTELQADLGKLRNHFEMTEAERRELLATRESLRHDLSQLESSFEGVAAEKETLVSHLSVKEWELREAIRERARAQRERGQLLARSEALQQRLASLQHGQQEVLERLSARTAGSIGEIKGLIAKTGLDPDRLLGETIMTGLGGPFVEFDDEMRGDTQIATLNNHIDQWDELQQLLRRLPLASPLDSFVQVSSFGKRRDPINGKWAMHYGADFTAPSKAPVLSAAPGEVIFAGTNGSYGRIVEIYHGMGIRTRYGHLSAISVRKGQTVGYRQEIGVIGNSGRSTGLHLHYEVLVKDKPYDPMRFIEAGKDVFKG